MSRSFEDNKFNNLAATDPERQRAIARAGGIASGAARRKKKAKNQIYGAIMAAALEQDFASPEELKAFRKWRKMQAQKKKKPPAAKE